MLLLQHEQQILLPVAFQTLRNLLLTRFHPGTPATIYTIANTGAMLSIGQERSREYAALAAKPGCATDSTCTKHSTDIELPERL